MQMQANLEAYERALLRRTRSQKKYVMALERKAQRLPCRGDYRSPGFDGMPGGGGVPCGLDGSKERNDAELKRLEEAQDTLSALQIEAEKIIGGLDWRLSIFARLYFIEALEVQEIAAQIEKDDSTCWRYLRTINGTKRRRVRVNARKCQ